MTGHSGHTWPLHRQNNHFLLKTSPVNSVLRAGSGNFLHFTWDLFFFPCQQLSPSTLSGRGLFPRGRPGGQEDCVFHTRLSTSDLPCAVPQLPAAQMESTPAASRLGTQGKPSSSWPRHKAPRTAAGPWRRKQQAWYLVTLKQWGVCARELGEHARRK